MEPEDLGAESSSSRIGQLRSEKINAAVDYDEDRVRLEFNKKDAGCFHSNRKYIFYTIFFKKNLSTFCEIRIFRMKNVYINF